jgi:DNA-binding GntR family transcriptional regulator
MVQVRTLGRQVYEHLLQRILSGELVPGTTLREGELAAQLEVSRTPIREALGRLSEYGVVESRPNHGAVVRRLGREELIHIYQVREALEGMAIQLACGKLTDADFARLDTLAEAARDPSAPHAFKACDDFDAGLHLLIADRTGNPILAREIRKLHDITRLIHDQLERVLVDGPRSGPGERREFRTSDWREHVGILAALKSGKPDDCRAAMVAHIRSASQYNARLFTTPDRGQDGHGAAATGTQVTEDEQPSDERKTTANG